MRDIDSTRLESRCIFRSSSRMKRNVATAVFFYALLSLIALPGFSTADESAPMIRSIKIADEQVVITVSVPAELKVITLEGRKRFGRGVWVPRSVKHSDGSAGEVVFRLPNDQTFEVFRVKGEAQSRLPAGFFAGEHSFAGQMSDAPPPDAAAGLYDESFSAIAADSGLRTASGDREVVESDIYQLSGDRLYFFNQYRGLQVIDVQDPDNPAIVGSLTMPLAGEQMYLLPENRLLLLAHDNCNWWSAEGGAEVVVVNASTSTPTVATNLPVHGRIKESRLVGSALYIASEYYRQVPDAASADGSGQRWEWGTRVASFDFSDPDHPVARDEHWFPGYGNVLHATAESLFVSVRGADHGNWWQSKIQVFDIAAPDGSMPALGVIHPAGRVADKFKMNLDGDVFTVISETSRTVERATHIETFDVSDASRPTRLGSVQVGFGESLFATRFDGKKAYIVTFRRIDPLWIVDLSDPANPTILGELEVPGWSTYMQPLGDRLLTIGIDDQDGWKVAVSLFDVTDPATPSLLSRVPLGDHYSWSEANHDEKALGYLPEENLVLVPFESSDANGRQSLVQLIDLGETALTKRGAIEHGYRPRRSLKLRDRILSLSGRELIATDASDRDHPVVTARLELFWSVDQVIVSDGFLIEIEKGRTWNETSGTLRIAPVTAPEKPLRLLAFEDAEILGATTRNGSLFLATAPLTPDLSGARSETGAPTPETSISVRTYDLSQLPELAEMGAATTNLPTLGWNRTLEPLWVEEDLLVWRQGGLAYHPFARVAFNDFFWFPGFSGNRLIAFAAPADQPTRFLSDHSVSLTNAWWIGGSAIPADGKIYLSHQTSVPVILDAGNAKTWEQKTFLQVVDYGDPEAPTERMRVNIPGELVGVSHNGSVLYTRGHHWTPGSNEQDYTEWLDASAYDGVQASLLDSVALGKIWPNPALVDSAGRVHAASAEAAESDNDPVYTYRLNSWSLDANGRFIRSGQPLTFEDGIHELASVDDLLIARVGQSHRVFEFRNNQISELANEPLRGCFWPQLKAADGNRNDGIWLPLGDYGLISVPLPQHGVLK